MLTTASSESTLLHVRFTCVKVQPNEVSKEVKSEMISAV